MSSYQDTAYIVMWASRRSPATYCELRRTDWGCDRLLYALRVMGYRSDEITVVRQEKTEFSQRGDN